MVALRRDHPNFRRPKFFQDRPIRGAPEADITWHRPDGEEMGDAEWGEDWVRVIGLGLGGDVLPEVDPLGQPVTDDTFLLLLNGHHEDVPFTLPSCFGAERWELVLDTVPGRPVRHSRADRYRHSLRACVARSLVLLRRA